MNMKIVEKMVPTKYIQNKYGEFQVSSILELIAELADCGYMEAIVISNAKLLQWFIEEGFVMSSGMSHSSVVVKNQMKLQDLEKGICELLANEE